MKGKNQILDGRIIEAERGAKFDWARWGHFERKIDDQNYSPSVRAVKRHGGKEGDFFT